MTDSDRPSAWDTISTIPCPPPDSSRTNLERVRAVLYTEREKERAIFVAAKRRIEALDAEIAKIDERLDGDDS